MTALIELSGLVGSLLTQRLLCTSQVRFWSTNALNKCLWVAKQVGQPIMQVVTLLPVPLRRRLYGGCYPYLYRQNKQSAFLRRSSGTQNMDSIVCRGLHNLTQISSSKGLRLLTRVSEHTRQARLQASLQERRSLESRLQCLIEERACSQRALSLIH